METDVFIELHVPDFGRVVDFYSKLGFKILWRSEDYLVMRMGKSVLSFYGDSNKVFSHPYFKKFSKKSQRGYGVEIIIPVDGVKSYYNRISKLIDVAEPLRLQK